MANGKYDIDTDDVPGIFKDLHKVAGAPTEVIYDMLINKSSPEDAVVKYTEQKLGVTGEDLTGPGSVTTDEFQRIDDAFEAMSDEEAVNLLRSGDVQTRLENILNIPSPIGPLGDELLMELEGMPESPDDLLQHIESGGYDPSLTYEGSIKGSVTDPLTGLTTPRIPTYPDGISIPGTLKQFQEGYPIPAAGVGVESLLREYEAMEAQGEGWNPYNTYTASDWEHDKLIAGWLKTFNKDILSNIGPQIDGQGIVFQAVRASLERLRSLDDSNNPGKQTNMVWDGSVGYFQTRPWLRPSADPNDPPGYIEATDTTSASSALEYNDVLLTLSSVDIDKLINDLDAWGEQNPALRDWAPLKPPTLPGTDSVVAVDPTVNVGETVPIDTSTYTGAADARSEEMFRQKTNKNLFLNEVNKMPGAGTFSSLANRDGMWDTARTIWYMGEGGPTSSSVGYGVLGQPTPEFGKEFVKWSKEWLTDPVGVLRSYQAEGGLAARARQAASDLLAFEKDMSSVYGQPFLEWAGENVGANIEGFFEMAARESLKKSDPEYAQWVASPSTVEPTTQQQTEWSTALKGHIEAAKGEYGRKLTNVAVFHPAFSGSTSDWRSGYRIPNTIGMDPYEAQSITRVLDQLADTMMEGGATYGEVFHRLNFAPVGRNVNPVPINPRPVKDDKPLAAKQTAAVSFKDFNNEYSADY